MDDPVVSFSIRIIHRVEVSFGIRGFIPTVTFVDAFQVTGTSSEVGVVGEQGAAETDEDTSTTKKDTTDKFQDLND